MAFASEGASTPFITRTPSNAVTLPLLTADAGLRGDGLAAGSAGFVALVPVPLFVGAASSDPAMTGAVAMIMSNAVHSQFLNFDISRAPSFARFQIFGTVNLSPLLRGLTQPIQRFRLWRGKGTWLRVATRIRVSVRLPHHQTGEWKYIGLEGHEDSHQSRQRNAVEEHVTQDIALVSVPLRGGAGNDNALGIDHFSHHATTTVRCRHQVGRDADLLSRDSLQAAEQHIRRRIRTGQRHAQPAQQRSEKRIEHTGSREGQPHRGVEPRIACQIAYGEHGCDGE